MVLVRGHPFVSAWLLLHVYVLVDVLDFAIVLFENGVFEYILAYSGSGGAVVHICKTYLCTTRKMLRGAKNEVATDVWEFQCSPSRILSSMVKCIFIPKDKHAITNLDNYGLLRYHNTFIISLLFIWMAWAQILVV